VQARVTLNVPVNLTQISPAVPKIQLGCTIRSDAITNGDEFRQVKVFQEMPITGGQVVATVPVVFNLTALDDPAGKSAYAVCLLLGWSVASQQWEQFHQAAPDPAFKTNVLVGHSETTFTW
jgi:hypothetical protein